MDRAPAIVHAWHVSGYAPPYSARDIKEAAINTAQIVAIEPEVLAFGSWDACRIEGARIITAASCGVYTHKNDSYDAARYNKAEVETRGGGSIDYVVMVSLQEALALAAEGRPFPIPPAVADWMVESANESAKASIERGWPMGWSPSAAELCVFSERGLPPPVSRKDP